jgi:MraZ protein
MAKRTNSFPNSFIGEVNFTVDARGRTNFPARFRQALSRASKNLLVIARGMDTCISVFPRDVWEDMDKDVNETTYNTPAQHRLALRQFYYGAHETGFDAQGRITIPERLLRLAKIEKNIVIVGVRSHVEIWNPDLYEQHVIESADMREAILEERRKNISSKSGEASTGGSSKT